MTRRCADECAPAAQSVGFATADGWSARRRAAVGTAAWRPAVGTADLDRRRAAARASGSLAGIAVLAVIAVTVVITVLVVGKDSGNPSPTRRRRPVLRPISLVRTTKVPRRSSPRM